MTLRQALKKNPVALRRPAKVRHFSYKPYNGSYEFADSYTYIMPGTWLAPEALLWPHLLALEDLTANDWQIKRGRKGRVRRGGAA